MADAANAAQRNLYPRHDGTRFTPDYRDGNGTSYDNQMHNLSWPVNTDVPQIGQNASKSHLPQLRQIHGLTPGTLYLHPNTYTKLRHTDHLSFSKSQGRLDIGVSADPDKDVFNRLYLGTRSQVKSPQRQAQVRYEMAADLAFKSSDAIDAVNLYTKAIKQSTPGNPNIYAYEKRCAALAELGRYREALKDAEFVLDNAITYEERCPAIVRVKTLKDFTERMKNFDTGYHHATSTLVCLLRPREHRKLVRSNPATYGRPDAADKIGQGLSASHSMASLLRWDKDHDGNIDLDEFKAGVASLGYKMHKREKNVFKGANLQWGYI